MASCSIFASRLYCGPLIRFVWLRKGNRNGSTIRSSNLPRGLFPMKFFFHSGIDREYGGDISSLTVKRRIQQLIESEDPKRPLSDSGLTEALKREGINIARRTVAKYRDELGVPSSTARKQIF